MKKKKIKRGKKIIKELVNILHNLSDSEIDELLGKGPMDDLLKAILDPSKVRNYPNIAEFLLANKIRASLLALIRHAITINYSFKGINREGQKGFVSPDFHQWYDDAVMFLEGEKRFEGIIGLYRNKEARYAISKRDTRGGEQLGPEDLEFISINEAKKRLKELSPRHLSDLDKPIQELQELLNKNERKESKYQEWIQKYPWVLSLKYLKIQRHEKLGDDIPDFTGVKVCDGNRDIFEIKQPFIRIFRKDKKFASDFNEAWNQIEKYVRFAKESKDYLFREKGLKFENPRGFLIVGHNLNDEYRKRLKNKEKMIAEIEILTYNDLLSFAKSTIEFLKNLKKENEKKE